MIRRRDRRDVLIRLDPAAKLFTHDAYIEARAKCIKEMGSRWVLYQAKGGRESEDPAATARGR